MNRERMSPGFPGKLVPIQFTEYPIGGGKPKIVRSHSYIPHPLPPKLDWSSIMVTHFDEYTKTVAAIGKLNGLHKRIGNAAGLLRTLWMREAKLSSQIENIDTTAEELVLAGAGRTLNVRESGRESWNYVKALEHGVSSELTFCSRVIKEMHSLLLSGVRGDENQPGEFRDCNVYLGDRSAGIENARFIPPPFGDEVVKAMSDLEKFVNNTYSRIPPLFLIALMHYQFETIHPFRDGNGRIGRVLISRSLVKEGLLEQPVVYMSAYISKNKQRYMDLLRDVSFHGGNFWAEWIQFILAAIHTQSLDAVWRSERLISLREKYHADLKASNCHARLFAIVDDLFSMPAINIQEVVERSKVTKPTASADLERLEKLGIVAEYTGRDRDRDWVARDIINVIEVEVPDTL